MYRLALLLIAALVATAATAHEVQTNRLTLVMREPGHLVLTFYLDYVDALHDALAPNEPEEPFRFRLAALDEEQLSELMALANRRFESEIQLVADTAQTPRIGNWRWPSAALVRKQLQEQVMAALTQPGTHIHPQIFEVRAEANGGGAYSEIRVRLPSAFDDVIVVSYRPHQTTARPGGQAAVAKF